MRQPFKPSAQPMTEIEAAELKQVQRQYRGFKKSWTLATFPERFALLTASWGDEADQMLSYVYEVMQRQNSVLLHPSPSGYYLAMTPGRRHPNRIGPDAFWAEALKQGCLGLLLGASRARVEVGLGPEHRRGALLPGELLDAPVYRRRAASDSRRRAVPVPQRSPRRALPPGVGDGACSPPRRSALRGSALRLAYSSAGCESSMVDRPAPRSTPDKCPHSAPRQLHRTAQGRHSAPLAEAGTCNHPVPTGDSPYPEDNGPRIGRQTQNWLRGQFPKTSLFAGFF